MFGPSWDQLSLLPEKKGIGSTASCDAPISLSARRLERNQASPCPAVAFDFTFKCSGVIETKRFTLDLSEHNREQNAAIIATYAATCLWDAEDHVRSACAKR